MSTRAIIRQFSVFSVIISTVGCIGTRYLDEGEYLLREQEIKGANKVDEDALDDFYRQDPNSKLPLLPVYPFVQLYQIGLRYYDEEALQQEKEEVNQEYDPKIETARAEDKENKVKRLAIRT